MPGGRLLADGQVEVRADGRRAASPRRRLLRRRVPQAAWTDLGVVVARVAHQHAQVQPRRGSHQLDGDVSPRLDDRHAVRQVRVLFQPSTPRLGPTVLREVATPAAGSHVGETTLAGSTQPRGREEPSRGVVRFELRRCQPSLRVRAAATPTHPRRRLRRMWKIRLSTR